MPELFSLFDPKWTSDQENRETALREVDHAREAGMNEIWALNGRASNLVRLKDGRGWKTREMEHKCEEMLTGLHLSGHRVEISITMGWPLSRDFE